MDTFHPKKKVSLIDILYHAFHLSMKGVLSNTSPLQTKWNRIILLILHHIFITNSHQDSTMAQAPKRGTILLMKHFVSPHEVTSKLQNSWNSQNWDNLVCCNFGALNTQLYL
jgi:hypothetical protein